MKVKLITFVLASSVVVGCQGEGDSLDQFRSTQLGVSLEETDTSLALAYSGQSNEVTVKTAELWCDDKRKADINFDGQQLVELFYNIENCKLKLTSFVLDGYDFVIDKAYSEIDGAYYFNYQNGNNIEDQRLVRAWQPIELSLFNGCEADYCDFYKSVVKFQYSVLDVKHVVLENNVYYNKIRVGMEEEAAPTCDDIAVAFVDGQDPYVDTINVEIKLTNCTTTIDMASKLEFGLAVETIPDFTFWRQGFTIEDAQDIINNYPYTPVQDGNNYTITLSLEEIKTMLGNSKRASSVNTVTALLADFVVSIRNEYGISALVYGIENKCTDPNSI